MQLVIKLYNDYWSNAVKDQVFIKSKVELGESLGSFGIATFDARGLEPIEYNRVELYEAGNPDTLVFKGFVYEPNKNVTALSDKTIMQCRNERAIMLKRKVLVARSKSDTIANIITELLGDYNTLGEGRASDVSLTKTVNISYNIGDVYNSIFDELAMQGGGYRTVENGVVVMTELLGDDRTFGSDFLEVVFDRTQDSNVAEIEIIGQSTRANIVIGVNTSGATHREDDIVGGNIYGTEVVSLLDGDLIDKTQQYLARKNIRQRILRLKLDPNKNIDAKVGDKLKLRIENVADLEDISSEVLVIKRDITYDYGRKIVNLTVGENIIEEDSLGNIIVGLKNEVDRLKV